MDVLDLIITVNSIQEYTMVFTCMLCFWIFPQLSKAQQVFAYYLFFLLVTNTIMRLLAFERTNNLMMTHILCLGEFIFLSLFFRELLSHQQVLKKLFRPLLLIFGGLIISNTLYLEKINTYNTNGKVLVLFVVIFFATAFFYDRSKRLMEMNIHERITRIINSALLLYYSGSFFVYLFYKFTQSDEIFYSLEMMLFNVILYLLFTLIILTAFLMIAFQRKKTSTG